MQTLFVELGARRYPIFIGHNLDAATLLAPYLHSKQVMMVTNSTISGLYLQRYVDQLTQLGKTVFSCILPDGEQFKDFTHLHLIFDALLQAGCNRDCTVVALGGGVIGDMAGYAAASFQRGVNFIQIPTTLLSQVDSSVGGKTGINHPLGKNMIGAFKQPEAVIADMALLESLPQRELSAGMAEVIKYALLTDADFLVWLEQHMPSLMAKEVQLLEQVVYRCCAHKARIVAKDETEQGERALLNLGHTFGHAIESYLGYGQWLHGEAVATGMLMAAELSVQQGWIEASDVQRIARILSAAQLPIACPAIPIADFLNHMSHDKKVLAGQLRLILLKQLGHAVLTHEFEQTALCAAIQAHQYAV
jgi:3-dehydroquinate synthase